jgi:hypothetical protein
MKEITCLAKLFQTDKHLKSIHKMFNPFARQIPVLSSEFKDLLQIFLFDLFWIESR